MPAPAPKSSPKSAPAGFTRHIDVDKSLIGLLSEATYTSFANCLRELVVNAFDADATSVTIKSEIPTAPDGHAGFKYAGALTIEDNGVGMDADAFLRYSRIAPGRPSQDKTNRYSRPRVGRFGIGYLAAFPYCERLEIRTRVAGNPQELTATFMCAEYFKREDKFTPLDKVVVEAAMKVTSASTRMYGEGTTITLHGLTAAAREQFVNRRAEVEQRKKWGRAPVDTVTDREPREALEWELGQTLPIRWTGREPWEALLGIGRDAKDPGLKVVLDGKAIEKPWPKYGDEELSVVLPQDGSTNHVRLPAPDTGGLSGVAPAIGEYRFLVITPHTAIEPKEFRGIQLRLRGVALGLPLGYLEFPTLAKTAELIRMSVEVHLLRGFDDLLTLDRTQLKKSPLLHSLLKSLEDTCLRAAATKGTADAGMKKSVGTFGGSSAVPADAIVRKIVENATKYGLEIAEDPTADKPKVSRAKKQVVVPTRPSVRSVSMRGESFKLVTSSDTRQGRAVVLTKDTIAVAPSLNDRLRNPNLHRLSQVILRLTAIEVFTARHLGGHASGDKSASLSAELQEELLRQEGARRK